jgi:CheY-like chemotaxis protein
VAKILVADDNSNIQKMVGLALKDQGIDVVAVGNGEAAVRKISDIKPDLVLADVFMPVRNGYEVCRYVKEDSALSHIPVILLVGAFDPLDEQEAQRVGADGVLKKPFVPPDPLISMVKSALVRAGVSLSAPAGAAGDKSPAAAPPKRSTQEILSGAMSAKLPSFAPEKMPEAEPEPVEEFPTAPPHLKIAAGNEPLAFGSLLETSETEDLAMTAKPMIDLSPRGKWDHETDEQEDEKEEAEESSESSWRPGGLDEAIERAAKTSTPAPDWREQAFHGNSPAKSLSPAWGPSTEQPEFAEAAESQSVAVATVPGKPAESPVPFTSDAWAAAMAAGVEEKLAEMKPAETTVEPERAAAPAAQEHGAEEVAEPRHEATSSQEAASHPASEGYKPVEQATTPEPSPATVASSSPASTEPANWAAVPETAWEIEAKKASLLASTWDAPKAFSVDDTQDVPVYSAEPHVEHTEPSEEAPAEPSAYSAEPVLSEEPANQAEPQASVEPQTPVEMNAVESEPEAVAAEETVAATQESAEHGVPTEVKSWEVAWEAPAPAAPIEPAVEADHAEPKREEEPAVIEAPQTLAAEPAVVAQPEAPIAAARPVEPDMDELVARVLSKMNPDVLQKVTREILKPVIEAIVRDEIESKKS